MRVPGTPTSTRRSRSTRTRPRRRRPPRRQRDAVLAEIAELAALQQVRAIGETGLDYYRDYAPPGVQRDWFRAHIAIAKQAGKALMIHDRDAHEDVLDILDDDGPPEQVIFHCFSGDAAMAKRCAEAGYVMSFAGNVTFTNARRAARGGRGGAGRAAPGRDRRAVPHPGAAPGQAELARAWSRTRCARWPSVKQIGVADLCAQLTATGERVFGPW